MTTPPIDPVEIVELGEIFAYLIDWFDADASRLAASLHTFNEGHYTLDELRDDLLRYAFLIGTDTDFLDRSADRPRPQ
jgi:hypothetical protein